MERPISEASRGFSDVTIRQFLLAGLSSEHQSAFEESLFTDPSLERRVRLAECELTDDYAFDRLRIPERKLFERNFLVSKARRNQLAVSDSLHDRFASVTPKGNLPLKSAFTEGLGSAFNLRQLSWKIAFAALLFLLLVGTSWLVIKKEPQIKDELTGRLKRKQAMTQTLPAESNHPANGSTSQHQTIASPQPDHEQRIQSPMSVTLAPDVTRERAPSIALPQGEHAVVRFELALKSNQATEYRAELVAAQGQTAFAGTATASSSSDMVSFDVPAQLLKQAEYQVRLLNAHSNVTVATYYFRVP